MGGAKNCPETPRQKMISMMYLVLTAMLALNVSAEIINGFTTIRRSMEASVKSTEARTAETLKQFKTEYEKDDAGRAKYGEWWAVASDVQQKSDEFFFFIEDFKLEIANRVDGPKEPYTRETGMPVNLVGGGDTNKPHAYAFNETDENGVTHADALEKRMDEFREYITVAESPCLVKKLENDASMKKNWEQMKTTFEAIFSTNEEKNQEGESVSWATGIFHEMPASAVCALLTKYQNDIRTAENEVINFLFNAAGASQFVVNQITAVVLPQNGEYVMQGQRYSAKIVSGAVDTLNLPQVFIGGKEIVGGVYEVTASGVGEHTYNGYILMPGDTTHYDFKGKYTVGVPSATIANLDMDLMYIGYNNRFSISVPGVSSDKVKIECPGASVTKQNGEWIIVPKSGKTAEITVRAEQNGKVSLMGSQKFRLKALPSPEAFVSFGGQVSAAEKMQKSILTSGQASIVASYGKDAAIQAKFTITSFSVKFPNGQSIPCNGGKFSSGAIDLMKKVKPGNIIAIRDVKAKGPDGRERDLRSLSIELQ